MIIPNLDNENNFNDQLDLLRKGNIDEITLSNGTVIRVSLSYRSRFPHHVTHQGILITLSGCLKSASLRRLCLYIFPDSWLVQDMCGLICFSVGLFLILYAAFYLSYIGLIGFEYLLGRLAIVITVWILTILALINQFLCMFTNPGAHMLNNCTETFVLSFPANSELFICSKCLCVKPKRTHHCSVCNRCIHRMDHHCPWINNCVGQRNQKFFVLYSLYVFCLSIVSGIVLILFGKRCIIYNNEDHNEKVCELLSNSVRRVLMLLFMGMETVLFGTFTFIILCSQLYSICTDQGRLDYSETTLTCMERIENLKAVFGGPFGYRWCLPFTPTYVRLNQFSEFANTVLPA